MKSAILNDDRPIQRIELLGTEDEEFYLAGSSCSEIRAYGEPGEYCEKPWVEVVSDDGVIARMPADSVRIFYG